MRCIAFSATLRHSQRIFVMQKIKYAHMICNPHSHSFVFFEKLLTCRSSANPELGSTPQSANRGTYEHHRTLPSHSQTSFASYTVPKMRSPTKAVKLIQHSLNNCRIQSTSGTGFVQRMLDQFDRLRRRNAFLEQYKRQRMFENGLEEFDDARYVPLFADCGVDPNSGFAEERHVRSFSKNTKLVRVRITYHMCVFDFLHYEYSFDYAAGWR